MFQYNTLRVTQQRRPQNFYWIFNILFKTKTCAFFLNILICCVESYWRDDDVCKSEKVKIKKKILVTEKSHSEYYWSPEFSRDRPYNKRGKKWYSPVDHGKNSMQKKVFILVFL